MKAAATGGRCKRGKEERGGSVSERSFLRRAEMFDQIDSVICLFFTHDKFSFVRSIVVLFLFFFL